jgi:hypothetical protein
MKSIFLVIFLIGYTLAQSDWWVTVYKDANFEGDSTDLGFGYPMCECYDYVGSDWNDVISSFDASMAPIIWYVDADCKGSSKKWGREKVYYVGATWNDKFSSFKFSNGVTC